MQIRASLKGRIHGKTIELEHESGLPDGQEVRVTLELLRSEQPLCPGDGIRKSAGAWADDPEGLDEFLELNRQNRKQRRPEIAS